jgi:hypothetical protein
LWKIICEKIKYHQTMAGEEVDSESEEFQAWYQSGSCSRGLPGVELAEWMPSGISSSSRMKALSTLKRAPEQALAKGKLLLFAPACVLYLQ